MDPILAWIAGFACCLVLWSLEHIVHRDRRPRESFSRAFERRLERKMSELSDGLVGLEGEVLNAEGRVSSDIASLKAKIAELEAQVAAGTASPADIAKLAELTQRVRNIDPAVASPPAP